MNNMFHYLTLLVGIVMFLEIISMVFVIYLLKTNLYKKWHLVPYNITLDKRLSSQNISNQNDGFEKKSKNFAFEDASINSNNEDIYQKTLFEVGDLNKEFVFSFGLSGKEEYDAEYIETPYEIWNYLRSSLSRIIKDHNNRLTRKEADIMDNVLWQILTSVGAYSTFSITTAFSRLRADVENLTDGTRPLIKDLTLKLIRAPVLLKAMNEVREHSESKIKNKHTDLNNPFVFVEQILNVVEKISTYTMETEGYIDINIYEIDVISRISINLLVFPESFVKTVEDEVRAKSIERNLNQNIISAVLELIEGNRKSQTVPKWK